MRAAGRPRAGPRASEVSNPEIAPAEPALEAERPSGPVFLVAMWRLRSGRRGARHLTHGHGRSPFTLEEQIAQHLDPSRVEPAVGDDHLRVEGHARADVI